MFVLTTVSADTTKALQESIDQSIKEAQSMSWNNWQEALTTYLLGFAKFGLKVILAFVIFYLGRKVVKLLMKPVKKFLIKSSLSHSATIFLTKLIHAFFTLVLMIIILLGLGLNASAVAAFIGSLGIVVGLAVQGSLSNLAGGILLIGTKPFEVGQFIIESTGNYQGTVTEIGMFYTKLLTPDYQEVIIPNGTLANATIVNVSRQENRRVDLRYIIKYESDFEVIKSKILDLLSTKEKAVTDDKRVLIESMDGQGVHLLVICWCQNADLIPFKFELNQDIFHLLHQEGIFVQHQIHIGTKG